VKLNRFAVIVVAAFAARMMGLAAVPPRWDEGWSIAHASLPIGELLRITAAELSALGWWPVLQVLLAVAVQLAGLLAERWFFFAQANHPQNLYYQAIS